MYRIYTGLCDPGSYTEQLRCVRNVLVLNRSAICVIQPTDAIDHSVRQSIKPLLPVQLYTVNAARVQLEYATDSLKTRARDRGLARKNSELSNPQELCRLKVDA